MKHRLLFILILLGAVITCSARKNSTRRPAPVAETAVSTPILPDTITAPQITLAGYDKPVDATRETILATNDTERTIIAITLTIKYFDHSGNLIHTATVNDIPTCITPGETMLVSWPTWDKNRTYYYAHSRQPSARRHAHPYTIAAQVTSALATP